MICINLYYPYFENSWRMAYGGISGELDGLYNEKKSVLDQVMAVSEVGGISGGGIAGYNCTFPSLERSNFL